MDETKKTVVVDEVELLSLRQRLVECDAKLQAQLIINQSVDAENRHLRDIIDKLILYGLQRDSQSVPR